jgi:hypothetical protein
MEYKRYDAVLENIIESLETFGIAVIPKVLVKAQCEILRNEIWKSPDMRSPHSQVCWDIRQYPKVVDVFAHIWKTQQTDMVTSFDGVTANLPPEITGIWPSDDNGFFQADQSIKKLGFRCVQGLVTLYPIRKGDATIQIVEGSHKYHDLVMECDSSLKYNGKECDGDVGFYIERGCKIFNVKADIGSIILWDSRTLHTYIPPQKGRPVPNFQLMTKVCMVPRSTFTPKQIEKKKNAMEKLYATTHWPCRINKKIPGNSGIAPELSVLGYKLAGF